MPASSGSSCSPKAEMARCLNCGEDLAPDSERCGTCGTDLDLLDEIRSVHSQPRYLFGSVELPQANVDPQGEPPARRTRAEKTGKKADSSTDQSGTEPPAKRNEHHPTTSTPPDEASAKPQEDKTTDQTPDDLKAVASGNDPALTYSEQEVLSGTLFDTTFLEDESAVVTPSPRADWRLSWAEHLLSIAVDFALLVMLNSIILAIISYQTSRSISFLITHSFFPLLIVHLAFSGILFFLFAHFFGHSPGTLLLKRMRKDHTTGN